jgi:hypothetical protein
MFLKNDPGDELSFNVNEIFLPNLPPDERSQSFACSVLLLEDESLGTCRAVLGDDKFMTKIDEIVAKAIMIKGMR